ncbi:MAG: hypothetical protein C0594_06165 [Marinilabiliales bacterium]|nr:MAG: hypothetical protein C0594_06165 [Marinilabiliales bacterium]
MRKSFTFLAMLLGLFIFVSCGGDEDIEIFGCTDPDAENYDPEATTDDETCVIKGCMDVEADNFDSEANSDDGSCTYSTGKAVFYTFVDYGYGAISIYVEGEYEGQVTVKIMMAECGTDGCVTIEKEPGTYNWNAESQDGHTTSGTVTIEGGDCKKVSLNLL